MRRARAPVAVSLISMKRKRKLQPDDMNVEAVDKDETAVPMFVDDVTDNNNCLTLDDTFVDASHAACASNSDVVDALPTAAKVAKHKHFIKCCVHGCPVTAKNAKHLKFFRFPYEHPRCILWAKLTHRKSIRYAFENGAADETQLLRICSAHFLITDFKDPLSRSKLTKNAVPSVLDVTNCPWYRFKDYKPNSSDLLEQAVPSVNSSEHEVPFMWDTSLDNEMRNVILGDYAPSPLLSPPTTSLSTPEVPDVAVDYSDLCAYHRLFVRSVAFVGTELEELKFCAKCGTAVTDPVKIAPNVYQIKCHRGHAFLVTTEFNERCHEWLLACNRRHHLRGKLDPPVHSPCHLCDDHFVPPHHRSSVSQQTISSTEIDDNNSRECNGIPDAKPPHNKFRRLRRNNLPQTFPPLVRHAFRFSEDVSKIDVSVGCDSPIMSDASVGHEPILQCDASVGSEAPVCCDTAVNCDVPVFSDASVGCEVPVYCDVSVGNQAPVCCDASIECDMDMELSFDLSAAKKIYKKAPLNGDGKLAASVIEKQCTLIEMLKKRLIVLNNNGDKLREQVKRLREWKITEKIFLEKVLPNYLSGISLKLVETQVLLTKRKRLHRWPPVIVALAKAIDSQCPEAFDIVRHLWYFPSRRSIRQLPPLPNNMLTLKGFLDEYFDGVSLIQKRPRDVIINKSLSDEACLSEDADVPQPLDESVPQLPVSFDQFPVAADVSDTRSQSTVDEAALAANFLLNSEVPFPSEEMTMMNMDGMPMFMDTEPENELEVRTSFDSQMMSGLPEVSVDNDGIVFAQTNADGSLVYHRCQFLEHTEGADLPDDSLIFQVGNDDESRKLSV